MDTGERYLIVEPANGGITDLLRFGILNNKASGGKFILHSYDDEEQEHEEEGEHRLVIVVSIILMKLIKLIGKPMEWIGYLVDFILNLLSINGGLLNLLATLLQGKMVVIPKRGSSNFLSSIGYIDGRINLQEQTLLLPLQPQNTSLMDLSVMCSKLAYENADVIKNVVNLHWKMHFVDFYDCWNEYQKERSTQVFIFCDKPKDANLIVISFRGTEPFDAYDWITDVDYSWYEIPNVGKVHMGFLEAIGLGDRSNTSSFHQQLLLQQPDATTDSSSSSNNGSNGDEVTAETRSAYFLVRSKLKRLLKEEHTNAKFLVTGHSLGGALAILFPTLLMLHEEDVVLERLLGVHTFGQPRIGNRELGRYVESKLQHPNPRYYRMVYCNDLVPRLPYDDKTFLYKHFGVCLYYNSLFVEEKVDEEPNRNYYLGWKYMIPEFVNAVWELVRGLTMGKRYGREYKESWECIMLRIVGLAIPGLSAHSLPNYIDSIRLGTLKHPPAAAAASI